MRYARVILFLIVGLLAACSTSRRVPEGEYLLDKVSITTTDSCGGEDISVNDLSLYLKQHPNHKMLWSMKLRLGVYNMAGTDTTKWWNRWWRRLGEPPVIYDPQLTEQSVRQLSKVLENRGYLHPHVYAETQSDSARRKMKVNYRVNPGELYTISEMTYEIEDSTIRALLMRDTTHLIIRPGDALNRANLDLQRQVILRQLRNEGYFGFNKKNISFVADTTQGSTSVALTMRVTSEDEDVGRKHIFDKYILRNVVCITDFDPSSPDSRDMIDVHDTVDYRGLTILYGSRHYLRPGVLR
ncbi:MAG: outer membrane protein assembly factor, partial [Muribaculaceae bacterium]|nr:outer membrane protein assembly factor [Muribaculaceae bacterium]